MENLMQTQRPRRMLVRLVLGTLILAVQVVIIVLSVRAWMERPLMTEAEIWAITLAVVEVVVIAIIILVVAGVFVYDRVQKWINHGR